MLTFIFIFNVLWEFVPYVVFGEKIINFLSFISYKRRDKNAKYIMLTLVFAELIGFFLVKFNSKVRSLVSQSQFLYHCRWRINPHTYKPGQKRWSIGGPHAVGPPQPRGKSHSYPPFPPHAPRPPLIPPSIADDYSSLDALCLQMTEQAINWRRYN